MTAPRMPSDESIFRPLLTAATLHNTLFKGLCFKNTPLPGGPSPALAWTTEHFQSGSKDEINTHPGFATSSCGDSDTTPNSSASTWQAAAASCSHLGVHWLCEVLWFCCSTLKIMVPFFFFLHAVFSVDCVLLILKCMKILFAQGQKRRTMAQVRNVSWGSEEWGVAAWGRMSQSCDEQKNGL